MLNRKPSTRLDVRPIDLLHRGHDGFITFHRKDADPDGPGFQGAGYTKASELVSIFPQFVEQLERDSYFSLNGFFRPVRKTGSTRWITSCYADLDVYRVGRTVNETIKLVLDLQDNDAFPPASIIVRSGRGVWLVWILNDNHDTSSPVRAWPEVCINHRLVQQAIQRKLAPLGSDPNAIDLARITRVPGSINTKANRFDQRVQYWVQHDGAGRPYSYTLNTLADRFAADLAPPAAVKDLQQARHSVQGRGWRALHNKRAQQFAALRAIRGGFRESTRYNAALVLAHILHKRHLKDDDIRRQLEQLADECKPPLPRRELDAAMRGGRDISRLKDQTISDRLRITKDESEQLAQAIERKPGCRWNPFPPAIEFAGDIDPTIEHRPTRTEQLERRRSALQVMRDGFDTVPPLRALSDELSDRFGIQASIATIRSDLNALDIRTGREHPRALPDCPMFSSQHIGGESHGGHASMN